MKSKILTIAAIILAFAIEGFFIFKNTRAAREINLDSFDSIYNRATQFRFQDKVDSSIKAYEKAINLMPRDKNALYYLGVMYKKERDFEKARQTWEKLIKLDPQSERAFIQMGDLYFCMTHRKFFNPSQAKFYFQRANELNKNSLVPLLRLGEIALYLEKTQEALDIFNKISTIDQSNVEINFLNGFLFWKLNKETQAKTLLKRAFLSAKTDSNKIASSDDNRQCNLFAYYTTAYINKSSQPGSTTSMPVIFKEFDQYLILMRDQLNPH